MLVGCLALWFCVDVERNDCEGGAENARQHLNTANMLLMATRGGRDEMAGRRSVVVRRLGPSFVVGVVHDDGRGMGEQRAIALDLTNKVVSNSEGRWWQRRETGGK